MIYILIETSLRNLCGGHEQHVEGTPRDLTDFDLIS